MPNKRNYKNAITLSAGKNYSQHIRDFMSRHGLHKVIGFSGGSDDKLPGIPSGDNLQEQFKSFRGDFDKRIVTDALSVLQGHRVAILTGGTKWGVPETACKTAKDLGFKTIGVFPRAGRKYAMDDSLLDLSICVDPLMGESRWGDECPVWVSLCDGIIVIGGGAGTLTECAHIQKINEALVKYHHIPKYIVPIHNTGGVAHLLSHIWAKPEIKTLSMPADRVHNGADAANILVDRLHLYDFYDHHYHNDHHNIHKYN